MKVTLLELPGITGRTLNLSQRVPSTYIGNVYVPKLEAKLLLQEPYCAPCKCFGPCGFGVTLNPKPLGFPNSLYFDSATQGEIVPRRLSAWMQSIGSQIGFKVEDLLFRVSDLVQLGCRV